MKERNKTASFAIWAGGQAARMVLLLLLVSMVSFVLLSVSPLDPLQTNVGQAALGSMSPEQIERLRTYWGVDVPPVRRYTLWLIDLLKGDMGVSLLYRRSVYSFGLSVKPSSQYTETPRTLAKTGSS